MYKKLRRRKKNAPQFIKKNIPNLLLLAQFISLSLSKIYYFRVIFSHLSTHRKEKSSIIHIPKFKKNNLVDLSVNKPPKIRSKVKKCLIIDVYYHGQLHTKKMHYFEYTCYDNNYNKMYNSWSIIESSWKSKKLYHHFSKKPANAHPVSLCPLLKNPPCKTHKKM